MKDVLVLLPDGVGIRNYLYSSLLADLCAEHEVSIISSSAPQDVKDEINRAIGRVCRFVSFPPFSESWRAKFHRETETYARLMHNAALVSNETIMINWRPSCNSLRRKVFYSLVETCGRRISASYTAILEREERLHSEVRCSRPYHYFHRFLKDRMPDLLFCTHQRAINAVPAFLAAQDLGIRTVSAIFSWDNLPKARLLVKADEYLVWSEYMKEEMLLFYPEEGRKLIHVTGTPQFEFYFDQNNQSAREEFSSRFGLDPDKKTICYSGGDTRTSPYDQFYLADLAAEIKDRGLASRVQILFRRCPVDFSSRFDSVLAQYADVIRVAEPLWRNSGAGEFSLSYPLFEDVKLLVSIAQHCDAVYNVGSTMAHDFFIFDKPAMYVKYDPPQARNWSVEQVYRFQHFRSMPHRDCVTWIQSPEEIAGKIVQTLEGRGGDAGYRRQWLERIVGPQPCEATKRIRQVLLR